MVEFNGGPSPQIEQRDGYEIWRSNGAVTADVQSGETVENVLVEHSGGSPISFRARTVNGWTIRNVGFSGVPRSKHEGGEYAFLFRVAADHGGVGTVENVYAPGWGSEFGGIYIRSSHHGRVNIRNTSLAGFGNNSVYGSAPGKNGNTGSVVIENCYSNSSTTGNFRIGTPGSRVRDSLVVLNDPNCRRGPYPNSSAYTARPVWASHHPDQRAENVHIVVNPNDCNPGPGMFQVRWCTDCGGGSGGNSAELTLQGCHVNQAALDGGVDAFHTWGSDGDHPDRCSFLGQNTTGQLGRSPTPQVLGSGVPLSAEMAARGNRDIPDIDTLPGDGPGNGGEFQQIEISSGSERVDYNFRATGEVRAVSGIGLGDQVDGDSASGFVRGGTDIYEFSGELMCFSYDGPEPNLVVGGRSSDPAQFGDCDDIGTPPPVVGNFQALVALGLVSTAVLFRDPIKERLGRD